MRKLTKRVVLLVTKHWHNNLAVSISIIFHKGRNGTKDKPVQGTVQIQKMQPHVSQVHYVLLFKFYGD